MPNQEPTGEDSASVSGQGMQLGSNNTQYNAWMPKPPLDPAALAALNPRTAVKRLQKLTHDELVDFFARASPEHVSDILEVFLECDEARIVAMLADIKYQKTIELVGVLDGGISSSVIGSLPDASESIALKAASLKLADAGPLERFASGYVRKYRDWRFFWHPQLGSYAARHTIEECWAVNKDLLEFPTGDEETSPTSPLGTTGVCQEFQGAVVYSSRRGTYCVGRAVEELYSCEGGSAGWLGFPVSTWERSEFNWIQEFEGGAAYSELNIGGVFAVRKEMSSVFQQYVSFHPVSPEADSISYYGTPGRTQRFKVSLEIGELDHMVTAAYSIETRAIVVAPEIWGYYIDLGAEKSWLGFPAKHAQAGYCTNSMMQQFEGGIIFWSSGSSPAAVHKVTMRAITEYRMTLGLPVSDQQSVGKDFGTAQYFENGIVTVRDGKCEVWVRPISADRQEYAVPEHTGGFRPDPPARYVVPEHVGGFRPDPSQYTVPDYTGGFRPDSPQSQAPEDESRPNHK